MMIVMMRRRMKNMHSPSNVGGWIWPAEYWIRPKDIHRYFSKMCAVPSKAAFSTCYIVISFTPRKFRYFSVYFDIGPGHKE